jgi:hypothetical protein
MLKVNKREIKMRALFLSVVFPLALTCSAFAQQPGNPPQPSGPQVQQQDAAQPGQIRAKISQKLQAAGFTDIRMMPTSFMVRAKDPDGNPVMMLINPDSVEAISFDAGTANQQQANPTPAKQ